MRSIRKRQSSLRRRQRGARSRQSSVIDARPIMERMLWCGRRLLGLAGLLGVISAVVYGVQHLSDAQKFPLRYVYLHGEWQYLDANHVQQIVAQHQQNSFFALDISAVQEQLSVLPWVASARVQRRWPDGLDVTLSERQVVARWAQAELIDQQGERFQPTEMPVSMEWPLLNGPNGQEQEVLELYRLAQQQLRSLNVSIIALMQDARGAWSFQLDNGLNVKLGKTDLQRRLQRFALLYPRSLQPQLADITSVDLRYTNALAVQWNRLSAGNGLANTQADASPLQRGAGV